METMAYQNGVVLQRSIITSNPLCYRDPENGEEEEVEEDAIELTLGLSLNGRFGTDPRSKKRMNNELTRSSSIPEGFAAGESRCPVTPSDTDMFKMIRTRSLPVDTEEEEGRRLRKELQSRRRMEAKRKRSEKTRALPELHTPRREEEKRALENFKQTGISNSTHRLEDGGARRMLDGNDHYDPDDTRGKTERREKKNAEEDCGSEKARRILENMPSVATREVGDDGKPVEGFLYWFGKEEDVRILCVCHGTFLSPADFLSHRRGSSTVHTPHLLNPLRQIIVRPPLSSPSL